jgi:hypothetical protein
VENISSQPLWYNSRINIEHIPTWHKKGIIYLGDLLNTNGDLLTWADLKTNYNIKGTFLDHTKLIKNIPKEWIVALKGHVISSAPRAIPAVMILCNVKTGCRKYYEIITKKTQLSINKALAKMEY